MFLGAVVFAGKDWLLPAAGLVAAAACLLAWDVWRTGRRDRWLVGCAALKLLAVTALAVCLVEPTWVGQRAKPGSNFFLVLADNSEGMRIHDPGNERSRGEELRTLLTGSEASWLRRLQQDFQLRNYAFDARVQSVADFRALQFDGRASAIGSALKNLADRYRGQPLAGILLLSDGNATDMPDGRFDATGLPPVHVVVAGADRPPRDVAIEQVRVSQTVFEDAPVTVEATVRAPGYAGEAILAKLLDTRGAVVAERTQSAGADGEPITYRFQVRPDRPGAVFYRLEVAARSETNQFLAPERAREATLVNNRRAVLVNRQRGPYRLLYVAGRPNWEFKFLNRAMQEDPELQLSALIRIARREPKFEFRGRRGESSNPLFRGFDRTNEETERYDQPVLKRLNTEEGELIGGFPKTAEELFSYHAIIFDDLEAAFFTTDQLSLVQKFVSERGGGFLMLGGQESFKEGRYERTPIADVLPVYLTRPETTDYPRDLKWNLSREGWLQPWARLRDSEGDEKARLAGLPPFLVLNRVGNPKPAASVIATVSDSKGRSYPALVGQQFGLGRSAAVMVGDMWHGGLQSETAQRDLGKAWRQLVRWLITDVPERVRIEARAVPGEAQATVNATVRVLDKTYKPMDLATVTLHVLGPTNTADLLPPPLSPTSALAATNTVRLTVEPSPSEAGSYSTDFVPRANGGYLAEAVVTDARGAEIGRAQTGWVADPASDEFRSLVPNRALLERIAGQTGGEVVPADRLSRFAESLPNRKAPITESWSDPLWHRSSVFLFALCCMVGDWGIRRWRGHA